jgi:hypothetical protein
MHLPAATMTPAQMFAHGIARAGYIEAPRDPYLAYEFLHAEARTIQHYGVQRGRLRYVGDVLTDLGNRTSPYTGKFRNRSRHLDRAPASTSTRSPWTVSSTPTSRSSEARRWL